MKLRRLEASEPAVAELPRPAPAKFEEEYFTPEQLSKKWHVSVTTIRRWFRDEPGTLQWGNGTSRPGRKKAHLSLRIPASVAARVLRRMTRT